MTCEGHLTPGLEGNELVLNFTGKDVPLEEELRDAFGRRARTSSRSGSTCGRAASSI